MTIRPATYDEVLTLKAPRVGHNPKTSYIGAFEGEVIVGCVGWRVVRPGCVELCGDVVRKDKRRQGVYRALCGERDKILKGIPHRSEVAYCTRLSFGRYIAAGFTIKRTYKNSVFVKKEI